MSPLPDCIHCVLKVHLKTEAQSFLPVSLQQVKAKSFSGTHLFIIRNNVKLKSRLLQTVLL